MLDPMKHNYMKKLMKLYGEGKLPPVGVSQTDVCHDDWCAIHQGRYCNCDPDIVVRVYRREDPRRN
jgi:hypothetical protein